MEKFEQPPEKKQGEKKDPKMSKEDYKELKENLEIADQSVAGILREEAIIEGKMDESEEQK